MNKKDLMQGDVCFKKANLHGLSNGWGSMVAYCMEESGLEMMLLILRVCDLCEEDSSIISLFFIYSFSYVLPGNTYRADVEHWKRRIVEWDYHESLFDFFSQPVGNEGGGSTPTWLACNGAPWVAGQGSCVTVCLRHGPAPETKLTTDDWYVSAELYFCSNYVACSSLLWKCHLWQLSAPAVKEDRKDCKRDLWVLQFL